MVLSWGEFDPAFEEDGPAPRAAASRVQGDRHGGRNVSDIDRLSLVLVTGS
jgi:hypothetical protein